MDINKIAKEMTREEFLKRIVIDSLFTGYDISCPSDVDLETVCDLCKDCKGCWENAIKDIKFKGEDNMENKIDYDREYNIMEIMEFPEETEIKNQYNMFYKISNNDLYYKEDENKWVKSDVCLKNILNMKFKLITKDKKVSFEEAIQAYGKEIYCILDDGETKVNYYIESKNSPLLDKNNIIGITPEEILNGEWYIKED